MDWLIDWLIFRDSPLVDFNEIYGESIFLDSDVYIDN